MTKTLVCCLALSFVWSAFISPARADSSSPSQTPNSGSGIAAIPKKAVAFVVGSVVGTPVSLVRRVIHEDKEGIKGMVGDTDNKFQNVTAASFWLPFSMLLGAAEAPIYGPLNSLSNINRPFSREQMGLGDHLLWANDTGANSSPSPAGGSPAATGDGGGAVDPVHSP